MDRLSKLASRSPSRQPEEAEEEEKFEAERATSAAPFLFFGRGKDCWGVGRPGRIPESAPVSPAAIGARFLCIWIARGCDSPAEVLGERIVERGELSARSDSNDPRMMGEIPLEGNPFSSTFTGRGVVADIMSPVEGIFPF
jgi:hypothetical protein